MWQRLGWEDSSGSSSSRRVPLSNCCLMLLLSLQNSAAQGLTQTIPKAPFKPGRLWDFFPLYNNQIETNKERQTQNACNRLETDLRNHNAFRLAASDFRITRKLHLVLRQPLGFSQYRVHYSHWWRRGRRKSVNYLEFCPYLLPISGTSTRSMKAWILVTYILFPNRCQIQCSHIRPQITMGTLSV